MTSTTEAGPPMPRVGKAVAATGPTTVLARLAGCHYQAERLRLQLLEQRSRIRIWQRRLAAVPVAQAALPASDPAEPTDAPDALRRRWLARLLEEATDCLPANTATAMLLAARHSAWRHEAACLETTLAIPSNGWTPHQAE